MSGSWREWIGQLWAQDRGMVLRLGVVLVIGLGLLVWGSQGTPPVTATIHHPGPSAQVVQNSSPLGAEEAAMDQELRGILAAVPGAGRVSVAVTLSRSMREQYSAHGHLALAQLGPAVDGVVVVADGASQPLVREELVSAVETLLQIGAYRVLVLPDGGAG